MKIAPLIICCILLSLGCTKQLPQNYNYEHTSTITNLEIPNEWLSCDCHTQGVAWSEQAQKLLVTCQGADGYSYIVLFPDYKDKNKRKAIDIIRTNAGKNYSHPSAIQILDDRFPVAFTAGKQAATEIQFFKINDTKIQQEPSSPINYHKHLGALAYFQYEENYFIIGVGWDAAYFAIWTSSKANADFSLIKEGELDNITDGQTGAYNSLWAGRNAENDLVLMASCGSFFNKRNNYLDIFQLDIEKGFLKQKERVNVPNITQKTIKSLFFEGVTVRESYDNGWTIIAAPQDFKWKKGKAVLSYVYEGKLVLKD